MTPLIAALALLATSLTARAMPDLSAYRWKSRVLVLRAAVPAEITRARERLLVRRAALTERDVVLVEDSTGGTFEILLYGKDGGKKWQGGADFSVDSILALIDAMPMRAQEQRER